MTTERTSQRSERSSDPLVGSVINGKFHIHKAIARGGMGRIYYGTQAPLDRPVALKIVKADSINEDESQFLKRFLLEASILAKLQHPNVVTLFDYGRIEGAPVEMYFIAMEFLDGETLGDRLRSQGALATYEMLLLFRQMARGLREAHSRGVVHRDLKPSNIVIVSEADGGEIVKLVDFGIGKDDQKTGEDLTRDGILVGTPKYMAPEQFDGISSQASDVYALGVIAYQCVTGSLPFTGNTLGEMMVAKLQHPIPSIRQVNPISDVTENVERLIYQMLARRPEERPTLEDVFKHLAVCEEEIFGASSGPRLGGISGSRPSLGFPNSSQAIAVLGAAGGEPHVAHTLVTQQPFGGFQAHAHRGEQATQITPAPRVPHAAQPGFGASLGQEQAHASGVAPVIASQTPRPMATSAFPSSAHEPRASSFPVSIAIALIFALGSFGVVAVWFAATKTSLFHPASTAGATTQTSTASGSAASSSSIDPQPQATSFTLHLDSTPSGAAVTEDGNTLGVTPLTLKIERQSVANGPRTFQIKKEGWSPTVFAQGPTSEPNIETIVPLTAEPAHVAKTAPHAPNPNASTKPHAAPSNTMQGESDIRLKR